MKDLEVELLKYKIAEEFLVNIRKEFGEGDEKIVKIVELKKLEQKRKTMKEFVQKFRRAARSSRYKERFLVEEFKRGINGIIYQRLTKSE